MRKFALLAVLAAALAVPGIAAADTAQGKLTGSATVNGIPFAIGSTVIDGGTSYVGLENDRSTTDKCAGDSGSLVVTGTMLFVNCAHFVLQSRGFNAGSPKMRFSFLVGISPLTWAVVRITDNGATGDTYAQGTTSSLADAQAWVNTGAIGSGHPFSAWEFRTVEGNFTVAP